MRTAGIRLLLVKCRFHLGTVIHECPAEVEDPANGDNQPDVRSTIHVFESFAQNERSLASRADIRVLLKHDGRPPEPQVPAVRTR
jgi:hypothetical protein